MRRWREKDRGDRGREQIGNRSGREEMEGGREDGERRKGKSVIRWREGGGRGGRERERGGEREKHFLHRIDDSDTQMSVYHGNRARSTGRMYPGLARYRARMSTSVHLQLQ